MLNFIFGRTEYPRPFEKFVSAGVFPHVSLGVIFIFFFHVDFLSLLQLPPNRQTRDTETLNRPLGGM